MSRSEATSAPSAGPVGDSPLAPLDRRSTSYAAALGQRVRSLYAKFAEDATRDAAAASSPQEAEDIRAAHGLRFPQYLIRAFFADPAFGLRRAGAEGAEGRSNGPPPLARGLLINHEMGEGKTIAAAVAAEAARSIPRARSSGGDADAARDVLVLLTKSLQSNFTAEYAKAVQMLSGDADAPVPPIRYVTANAHNSATQMARAAKGETARAARRRAGAARDPFADVVAAGSGALEGKFLVVEEAHNFFRAVLNQGKNAVALYNMIHDARDLYVVFLSGTVPSKDPFELAVCFNLLAGEDVLPTDYTAFRDHFVETRRALTISADTAPSPAETVSDGDIPAAEAAAPLPLVRNLGKYQNRILGLVSYIRHALPHAPGDSPEAAAAAPAGRQFPERRATVVERIPMGERQFREYLSARAREDAAAAPTPGKKGGPGDPFAPLVLAPLAKPGRSAGSTYHVETRQIGNFAPPEGWRGGADKLPDSALTPDAGPKMARAVEIALAARRPVLVYSQYTGIGGLGTLERYLQKAGFRRWRPAARETAPAAVARETAPPAPAADPSASKSAPASAPVAGGCDTVPDCDCDCPCAGTDCMCDAGDCGCTRARGGAANETNEANEAPFTIVRVAPDELEAWMDARPEQRASLIARGDGPEIYVAEHPGAPEGSTAAASLMHWFAWGAPEGTEDAGGERHVYLGHAVVARAPPPDAPRALQQNNQRAGDADPEASGANPEASGERVWLARVHVVGAARRQGIGRALAEKARRWAGRLDARPTLCGAAPVGSGTAFMRALGWIDAADADSARALTSGHAWGVFCADGAGAATTGGAAKAKKSKPAAKKPAAAKKPTAEKPAAQKAPSGATLYYAVHSGDVDPAERDAVEEAFRAESNKYGADIKVLLLSKTGAEGLNLRYAEETIALEPYWDEARPEQFYARVIRPGSHALLPPSERWVQPRLFVAVSNPELASDPPVPTTDEELQRRAARDMEMVRAFREANMGASIEAVAFGYPGARLCAPTGAPLYTGDFGADMRGADPCRPLARREASLPEVELPDGGRYPFREDPASAYGWRFFRYDPDAGAHVPVPDNDPQIEALLDARAALAALAAPAAPAAVKGGRVAGPLQLPHYRDHSEWKKINKNPAAYKKRLKRYGAMTADELDALDWSPVDAAFLEFMESRYETGGTIDLVRGKMHVVSVGRGDTDEVGQGGIKPPSVPGMFQFHTHPHALVDVRKLTRGTRHVLPFVELSAEDLTLAFQDIARGEYAWGVLEAPQGRYFYRPDKKLLGSRLARALSAEMVASGDSKDYSDVDIHAGLNALLNTISRVLVQTYNAKTGITLANFHRQLCKVGFTIHYFPDPGYARRFPPQTYTWKYTTIYRPVSRGTLPNY